VASEQPGSVSPHMGLQLWGGGTRAQNTLQFRGWSWSPTAAMGGLRSIFHWFFPIPSGRTKACGVLALNSSNVAGEAPCNHCHQRSRGHNSQRGCIAHPMAPEHGEAAAGPGPHARTSSAGAHCSSAPMTLNPLPGQDRAVG